MHVVARLRRGIHGGKPIQDLESYAASVAGRACDDHLRQKYPYRWRLKNQLRYVLSHDERFSLWETSEGWLAGLAVWTGGPRALGPLRPPRAASTGRSPAELLLWIFARSDGPLDLDVVVSAALEVNSDRDLPSRAAEALPDPRAGEACTAVEQRIDIGSLWREILALPLAQRTALLLNLRDGNGGDVIAALPAMGIASIRHIAEVLRLPEAELAGIWSRLPLPDREIAARLGVTRQQVINLRKAARARLARRTDQGKPAPR